VAQLPAILELVAAGLGVSLVPASLRRVRIEGAVHRPLAAGAPTLDLAIACRRSDAGTAAAHLVQAVSGLGAGSA
jgi:DNA-binding transcriptional LysR family regulator